MTCFKSNNDQVVAHHLQTLVAIEKEQYAGRARKAKGSAATLARKPLIEWRFCFSTFEIANVTGSLHTAASELNRKLSTTLPCAQMQ